MRQLFLDIETTGFSAVNDKITEIGINTPKIP